MITNQQSEGGSGMLLVKDVEENAKEVSMACPEGAEVSAKPPFLYRLRRDLRTIWIHRIIALKPLALTIVSLALLEATKWALPWAFVDFGKEYDKLLTSVFVALLVVYGFLGNGTLEDVKKENEKLEGALWKEDLMEFCKYFYRRIPAPTKVMLFCLSVLMEYCIAIFHYEGFRQQCVAEGIMFFMLYLAWMIATELDDPFSGSWNIRDRVPQEWWAIFSHCLIIHGTMEKGHIYIRQDEAVKLYRKLSESKAVTPRIP